MTRQFQCEHSDKRGNPIQRTRWSSVNAGGNCRPMFSEKKAISIPQTGTNSDSDSRKNIHFVEWNHERWMNVKRQHHHLEFVNNTKNARGVGQ